MDKNITPIVNKVENDGDTNTSIPLSNLALNSTNDSSLESNTASSLNDDNKNKLLNIKRIETGKWKENCYIISNNKNESIIIDPGSDKHKVDKYINVNKLDVCAIINTHGHYDHIGAVKYFKEKYSVPFYLHSKDLKLIKYS